MLKNSPGGKGISDKVSAGKMLLDMVPDDTRLWKVPPAISLLNNVPEITYTQERVSPGRGISETVPFTTEIREKVSNKKDILEKVPKELNEKVLSIIDVDEIVPTGREIHEKGPNNRIRLEKVPNYIIRLEKIPPIVKVGEMAYPGKAQDKVSSDCEIKSSFNPEIFESKEPLMKVPSNLKVDKQKSLQQGNSGWGILNKVSRQRKAKVKKREKKIQNQQFL